LLTRRLPGRQEESKRGAAAAARRPSAQGVVREGLRREGVRSVEKGPWRSSTAVARARS